MDNWTVSDVTGHAGVTGQYLANANLLNVQLIINAQMSYIIAK